MKRDDASQITNRKWVLLVINGLADMGLVAQYVENSPGSKCVLILIFDSLFRELQLSKFWHRVLISSCMMIITVFGYKELYMVDMIFEILLVAICVWGPLLGGLDFSWLFKQKLFSNLFLTNKHLQEAMTGFNAIHTPTFIIDAADFNTILKVNKAANALFDDKSDKKEMSTKLFSGMGH